ncbi:MAG: hypothetical protein ACO3RO_06520 [Flavobacteriaceae bacterium]
MEKNQSKALPAILGVLFVAAAAFAISLYISGKNTEEALNAEKAAVIEELEGLKSDYDKSILENNALSEELLAARSEIANYIDSVSSLKADVATLMRFRGQVYQLRKERETLMARLDSLTASNIALKSLNDQTQKELERVAALNDSIVQQNIILEQENRIAAQLKLDALDVQAVRVKNNGDFKSVNRAKRADNFKICFTVRDNAVAKAGDKNFFVEVMGPDGALVGNSQSVTVNSRSLNVSKVTAFYYENQTLDVCDYVENAGGDFPKGNYMVNIYDNDLELIGTSKFFLK